MSHGLRRGRSGSAGVRVVQADVCATECACLCVRERERGSVCGVECEAFGVPSRSCLHLRRGPEKPDLIWRVARPLFPTSCMLGCRGWMGWGGVPGRDGVYVRVSAGLPLLSTLRCCDCHDMCLNTVTPLLTHAHSHARTHTVASCIFFSILQRFRTSTRASYFVNGAYLPFHQRLQSFSPPKDPQPFPPSLLLPAPVFFTLIVALRRIKTPPQPTTPSTPNSTPCTHTHQCHATMLSSCCLPRARSAVQLQDILQQLDGDPTVLVNCVV